MKFGPAPLDEARGAIMAHTQRVGERMIRKGSVLDEAAIAALREAGPREVICARLEPGDVPEDIAADRLAHAAGRAAARPLARRHRAGEPGRRGAGPAAGRCREDRPAELDRRGAHHRHLPDYAVVAPQGHGRDDQDHSVLGARHGAGGGRGAGAPGGAAADAASVPAT